MKVSLLGDLVCSFLVDHLQVAKGLRPSSVASYRDGLRLFLCFVADDAGRMITRLSVQDLSVERVLSFLRYLEEARANHVRTRNQRLAILHAFFEFVASRVPEMLPVAQRVACIPIKRAPAPETRFLERSEVEALLSGLPSRGQLADRDRTLLLFLYNTGARVSEVTDLRVGNIDFDPRPRARLHGKGDKWRVCPLWKETAEHIRLLLIRKGSINNPEAPIFLSQRGQPLTRFGIYKIVRRHAARLEESRSKHAHGHITPHVLRHSTAVHLLEAGVEINVIRGWLGHVSLDTTNRYAEISIRVKEAALQACEAPTQTTTEIRRSQAWRNDQALLNWLDSL